jgi:hypothetical protein
MKPFDAVRLIEDKRRLRRDHIGGLAGTVAYVRIVERQTDYCAEDPGGGRCDILHVDTYRGKYWVRAEHVIPIDPPKCACLNTYDHARLDKHFMLCDGCCIIWYEPV